MNTGRRLTFLTGKGGVGKTTIACLLARQYAREGASTLLATVGVDHVVSELLGCGTLTYQPMQVEPGLDVRRLTPDGAIYDFFRTHFRFEAIFRPVLQSRFFKTLFDATPGLKDLIIVGKIWRMLEEIHDGLRRWDRIVIDAPATGHFIAMCQAVIDSSEMLRGPMGANARAIVESLRDPASTEVIIVCLPFEMPVREASELYEATQAQGLPASRVVMNQCQHLYDVLGEGGAPITGLDELDPALEDALSCTIAFERARASESRRWTEQAASLIALPIQQIPRLPQPLVLDELVKHFGLPRTIPADSTRIGVYR